MTFVNFACCCPNYFLINYTSSNEYEINYGPYSKMCVQSMYSQFYEIAFRFSGLIT